MDLVLQLPGRRGTWAIEVKRSLASRLETGLHNAKTDLEPSRVFVVYDGEDRFPLAKDIEAIGLQELARELAAVA
jgi:hypothetical protein